MRLLVARFARWLLAWADPTPPAPPPPPIPPEVETAVRRACLYVGVPMGTYSHGLSLGHKAEAVLYHAAKALDADHKIVTVGDVIEALR